MMHKSIRNGLCHILVLSLVLHPLCRHCYVQAAQAAPVSLPVWKAAQALERKAYKDCHAERVRRAYRFSAKIAELRSCSRANLAMQLQLLKLIRYQDLLSSNTNPPKLNRNAVFLYLRTVEGILASLYWRILNESDVQEPDLRYIATQVHDHLDTLANGNPIIRRTLEPTRLQLAAIARGTKPTCDNQGDDLRQLSRFSENLRRGAKGLRPPQIDPEKLAAELRKICPSVSKDQAASWVELLQEVQHLEAEVWPGPDRKPGTTAPPRPEELWDQYYAKLDELLNHPATRAIAETAAATDSGPVGALIAAILIGASLVDKWDSLSAKEKNVKIAKVLIYMALAAQVILTVETAGAKTPVLLFLLAAVGVYDCGFPPSAAMDGGTNNRSGQGDTEGENGSNKPDDESPDMDERQPGKGPSDDLTPELVDPDVVQPGVQPSAKPSSASKTSAGDGESRMPPAMTDAANRLASQLSQERATLEKELETTTSQDQRKLLEGKLAILDASDLTMPKELVDFQAACRDRNIDPNDTESAVRLRSELQTQGVILYDVPAEIRSAPQPNPPPVAKPEGQQRKS